MKTTIIYILLLFAIPGLATAQKADTLIKKLDSLTKKTVDEGGQKNTIAPSAYNETTKITFRTYFVLLGSDFKQQVTSPMHLDRKAWIKTGAVALFAGGLTLLDEPIQQTALKQRKYKSVVNVSKYVTNTGGLYETYTLAALGAYGFLFKNEKIKTTTFLATQSYITAGVIETFAKFLTGRERPSYTAEGAGEAEPRFEGPFKGVSSSFPSGHTTVAFAAATVYAKEYANKPLVPILSYSAATLIGLSRISENKHWASDVFVGGLLGYLCGRQVVNNYHRYAKIENEKVRKGHLSLNLNNLNGTMLPGLLYRP
jgi:hypothetical protein